MPDEMCYICKLGWLDEEETPTLVNHEGLQYCESCYKVIHAMAIDLAECIKKGAK